MLIHDHNDHNSALLEVSIEAGGLLRFSARDIDGTVWVHATPVQVRKIHAALGLWLSENGLIAPAPAAETVSADDVRRIAREELREMFRSYGNEHV